MATYPIKILKDENNVAFVPLTSTEGIQDPEGKTLEERLSIKLGPDNLHGGENISVRTENYDCYIDLDLPASLNVINNLTTSTAGNGALDAYQGKLLNDKIPGLLNSLTSNDATKALTASMGKQLNDTKVNKNGDTITGNLTINGNLTVNNGTIKGNVSLSDKSKGIVDYNDTNRVIKVGYSGDGLTTTNYFAAYNSDGNIKDIDVFHAKSVLGVTTSQLIDLIYPVGSIYITMESGNPSGKFHCGDWVQIPGRFLLGVGTAEDNSSNFYGPLRKGSDDYWTSSGVKAGQFYEVLSNNEIPSHTHSIPSLSGSASGGAHTHRMTQKTTSYATGSQNNWRCLSWLGTNADYNQDVYTNNGNNDGGHSHTISTNSSTTGSSGSGNSHNNMPPFITVYMWKRTR